MQVLSSEVADNETEVSCTCWGMVWESSVIYHCDKHKCHNSPTGMLKYNMQIHVCDQSKQ